MKKLFLFSSLCFIISSFAYTSEDTSNANYLADQGFVTKQATASKYRLDDKILRQEVIGMALKIKGITLPENYTCKKYFTDATKNDWVCRAVELAADNGIISRSNKYANPGKNITRAEALAMVMKAGSINIQKNIDGELSIYSDVQNDSWQGPITDSAFKQYIIPVGICDPECIIPFGGGVPIGRFYPDRAATRAEVFAFARNIINPSSVQSYEGFTADFGGDYSRIDSKDLSDETIVPYVSYSFGSIGMLEGGEGRRFSIEVSPIAFFMNSGTEYTKKYWNGHVYYAGLTPPGMCGTTGQLLFISDKNLITIHGTCEQTVKEVEDALHDIQFDVGNTRVINSIDMLRKYYTSLYVHYISDAYEMRSPAGVSYETFTSWYKNTESVIFREDTLKSLGDNTYEFLVDMTENGVKSTYKVKSKVNLEKFTIDNISSVKQ